MKPMLYVTGFSLAAALLSTAAFGAGAIGVDAVIRNSVQMKTASDAALRPAVVREPVHIGDALVSGPQSSAQLLLIDKSVFTVGANARMTLDRFVYDPNQGTGDIAASFTKGAFRFMSGNALSAGGRSAIRTPVATIGVRGTIVEGVVGQDALDVLAGESGIPPFTGDPANVSLIVLNGPGHKSQGFDKPGAIDITSGGVTVSIETPGMAVIVWGPDQPPFGPFALSDAAFGRLGGLLLTTPGQGGDQVTGDFESAAIAAGDILNQGDFGSGTPFSPATSIDTPQDCKPSGGPGPGGPVTVGPTGCGPRPPS